MDYFFSQLLRSIGVFFRTVRAFFLRKLMGLTSMLRRLTNFSRHATKVASSSLQSVMSAAQTPSDPSDYVETGNYYIAKALIIRIVLGIAAFLLIAYFLVWPFVLSHFLTAKFYEQDRRVADWTGRVIVYSDAKKTVPLYAGRLEKGVLQGDGKRYDGDGVLSYEGQMRDGQPDGSGREYRDGVLVYEGQFSSGLYSGSGKSYADGGLAYEGQFLNGLYEGRGRQYQAGVLSYDGSFHAGAAEGTGVSYDPTGRITYQGQYLAGLPDGIGTAYGENGLKEYAGGFVKGVYSGEGILYFDGGQLEADFENGAPKGVVSWKKNGLLYYQGEWSDGMPEGFGTLYSKAGKKLYEGQFRAGSIDCAGLLEGSTEALRSAFAEGRVKNEADSAGFLVTAEELGVSALCSFRTEEEDSAVRRIDLFAPEKDGWVELLPGSAHTGGVAWPDGAEPQSLTAPFSGRLGVNVAPGDYAAESVVSDGKSVLALYETGARKKAVLVTWVRVNAPQSESPPQQEQQSSSDGSDDPLLAALDTMIESGGTLAGAGAPSKGNGTEAVFRQMANPEKAVELTDAMIDYWESAARLTALQEADGAYDTLIEDARSASAEGLASAEAAKTLERERQELQTQIEGCTTALQRAALQAGALGVANPGAYALEELLVGFDPAQLKAEDLIPAAVSYAGATGAETGAADIQTAVRLGLLNLTDARGEMQLALSRCQALSESESDAAEAFSMGAVTRQERYEAAKALSCARADLASAAAEFSRQANRFDLLTGGWISRTFGWRRGVF